MIFFKDARAVALAKSPVSATTADKGAYKSPVYATGQSAAKLPVKQIPFVVQKPYYPGAPVGNTMTIKTK